MWQLGILPTSNGIYGLGTLGVIFTIISPVAWLEYIRVSRWWTKTTCHLKTLEYDTHSDNEQVQRDVVMVLLRADADCNFSSQESPINVNFMFDTSSFLLRIWYLLLESISVLESSIPVVRSLTVASSVADLTTNTICLVDLALEVKKRGLLGGAGVLIWDAFQHHLSKELDQRRRQGTTSDRTSSSSDQQGCGDSEAEEKLGGQYTGSIINAVGNVGKITHNVSCLIGKD